MKKQLINLIKGMIIGIGNIAPGLSGGVFAVSLNVYDNLIEILNSFFVKPFKTIKESWGLIAGVLLGVLVGFYLIIELIVLFPIPTMLLFIGFIIGSIPSIYEKIKYRKKKFIDYFMFILMIVIIVGLPFIGGTNHIIENTAKDYIFLLFVGMLVSATLILPGLSGSMILMVIGYYEQILKLIKEFINACLAFDISGALGYLLFLIPIAIGTIVGLLALSRLITRLFKTNYTTIYAAILGLVIASPFSIVFTMLNPSDPDNSYFDRLQDNLLISIIVGIIMMAGGAFISMYLAEKEKKNNESQKLTE